MGDERKKLDTGIYRIFWKKGGSSIAAVGMTESGDRWLAPINWVAPSVKSLSKIWALVESVQPIDVKR